MALDTMNVTLTIVVLLIIIMLVRSRSAGPSKDPYDCGCGCEGTKNRMNQNMYQGFQIGSGQPQPSTQSQRQNTKNVITNNSNITSNAVAMATVGRLGNARMMKSTAVAHPSANANVALATLRQAQAMNKAGNGTTKDMKYMAPRRAPFTGYPRTASYIPVK
jgi:hypothetical protein